MQTTQVRHTHAKRLEGDRGRPRKPKLPGPLERAPKLIKDCSVAQLIHMAKHGGDLVRDETMVELGSRIKEISSGRDPIGDKRITKEDVLELIARECPHPKYRMDAFDTIRDEPERVERIYAETIFDDVREASGKELLVMGRGVPKPNKANVSEMPVTFDEERGAETVQHGD